MLNFDTMAQKMQFYFSAQVFLRQKPETELTQLR